MNANDPVTPGQRMALNRTLGDDMARFKRLWVLTKLLGRTIETSAEVTVGEWRQIRDRAYPHWSDDDWETLSPEFVRELGKLKIEYEESVLGQQRLF